MTEAATQLKKYVEGKKNTEKVEINVLALRRIILSLEEGMRESSSVDTLQEVRDRIDLEKVGYPPSADHYKAIQKAVSIVDNQIEKCKVEGGPHG